MNGVGNRAKVMGLVAAVGLGVCMSGGAALGQTGSAGAGSGSLLKRNKTKLTPAPATSSKPGSKSATPMERKSEMGRALEQERAERSEREATEREATPASRRTGDLRTRSGRGASGASLGLGNFEHGLLEPEDRVIVLPGHMGREAEVGAIIDRSQKPLTSDDLRRGIADAARAGERPWADGGLRELVERERADAERVNSRREELLGEHYMEVQLDGRYSALIKGANWCDINEAAGILRERYGLSMCDPVGAYGREWMYEGDYYGRRSDDIIFGTDTYPTLESDDTAGAMRARAGGVSATAGAVMRDSFLAGVSRQAEEVVVRRENALERSESLMSEGKYDEAISALDVYLDGSDEEASVLRTRGVLKVVIGDVRAGVSEIVKAHEMQPGLSEQAVDVSKFDGGERSLRDATQRLVTLAGKAKGGEESFAAAVLMQAQGKKEAGRRLAQRAIEKGMKGRAAEWLAEALKP